VHFDLVGRTSARQIDLSRTMQAKSLETGARRRASRGCLRRRIRRDEARAMLAAI